MNFKRYIIHFVVCISSKFTLWIKLYVQKSFKCLKWNKMCNIFSIYVVVVMLFDPTFFPSFPLSIVSKGIIHYKNANFMVAWTWAYTLVQLKQVLIYMRDVCLRLLCWINSVHLGTRIKIILNFWMWCMHVHELLN